MKISFWGFALAALSALSLSVPASGAIVTQYNNRGTWQAATSGRYDIDFSRPSGPVVYNQLGSGLNFVPSPVTASVNFVGYYNEGGPTQNLLVWTRDDYAGEPRFNFGSGGLLAGGVNGFSTGVFNTGIAASFGGATGIRSIGLDYAAWQQRNGGGDAPVYPLSGALRLEVTEVGGTVSTVNLSNSTAQVLSFVGITFSGDIAGVRLITQNLTGSPYNNQNATAILDNFSFGALVGSSGGGGGGGGGGGDELPEPATFLTAAAACLLFSISRYWKR